jgi:hypothetical protein
MSPRQQDAQASRPRQQTRVRWWAVALPLAVFTTLFCLLASPAQAGERHYSPYPGLQRIEKVLPQVLISLFG